MSSSKVDDGTLDVNTATVVGPVSGWAAGSKSGRRDSAKYDSHLAIRCERCGLLTAVRKEAWSLYTMKGLSPSR